MNLSSRIRESADYDRVFSNLDSAGYYSALSQNVTILVADQAKYDAIIRQGAPLLAGREFFLACFHELTHWLDNVSTLWGQRSLVDIHNAFNAQSLQRVEDFWRIVKVNVELRRGKLQDYYTTVDQPRAARPWTRTITCGLEFDAFGRLSVEKPIVFISFFAGSDAQRVCRVPLTNAALTETTATWAEYYTLSAALWLSNSDEAVVERNIEQSRLLTRLYDPELALYSAATHLLGNSLDLTNAHQVYELSAALALLCLNLPDEAFDDLKIPSEISNLLGEREAGFRNRRDRGFAFYALAEAAPNYDDGGTVKEWLQDTIARAGLPRLEKIEEQVRTEMEELPNHLTEGPATDRALSLLQIGRQNYSARGVFAKQPLSLLDTTPDSTYLLPPVVLDDGAVVHTSHHQVTDPLLQPEVSLDLEIHYLSFARDLLEACTP